MMSSCGTRQHEQCTLKTPHSFLNTTHSLLNTAHSLLNNPHSSLKTLHSSHRSQLSTLNTQHQAWAGIPVPNFSPRLFNQFFTNMGWEHCFSFPFPIQKVGKKFFSIPFQIPNFPFHSQFKKRKIYLPFAFPIPKAVNCILADPAQSQGLLYKKPRD